MKRKRQILLLFVGRQIKVLVSFLYFIGVMRGGIKPMLSAFEEDTLWLSNLFELWPLTFSQKENRLAGLTLRMNFVSLQRKIWRKCIGVTIGCWSDWFVGWFIAWFVCFALQILWSKLYPQILASCNEIQYAWSTSLECNPIYCLYCVSQQLCALGQTAALMGMYVGALVLCSDRSALTTFDYTVSKWPHNFSHIRPWWW